MLGVRFCRIEGVGLDAIQAPERLEPCDMNSRTLKWVCHQGVPSEQAALRDLVPVLGLAMKSAKQIDIARTLAGSISAAMPPNRFCVGASRAASPRHQGGSVVLRFARLDRDHRKHRARRDHPVPQ